MCPKTTDELSRPVAEFTTFFSRLFLEINFQTSDVQSRNTYNKERNVSLRHKQLDKFQFEQKL